MRSAESQITIMHHSFIYKHITVTRFGNSITYFSCRYLDHDERPTQALNLILFLALHLHSIQVSRMYKSDKCNLQALHLVEPESDLKMHKTQQQLFNKKNTAMHYFC